MHEQKAFDILSSYADLQYALCIGLLQNEELAVLSAASDYDYLRKLPRRGGLRLAGELWCYQMHGAGIKFQSVASGEIVDPHVMPFTCPRGFDACRILSYLESRRISSLALGDRQVDVSEEDEVDEILTALYHAGALSLVHPVRKIYSVI